jgi:hypothetical protein
MNWMTGLHIENKQTDMQIERIIEKNISNIPSYRNKEKKD